MTTMIGLVGNLTADPELRFSKSGTAWCSVRLACTPRPTGACPEPETVFYEVVCFSTLAENVAECLSTGMRVVAVGRLEEDTWTGRDGVERTTEKLLAEAVGPDLRFATADVHRFERSQPASPPQTHEEPF